MEPTHLVDKEFSIPKIEEIITGQIQFEKGSKFFNFLALKINVSENMLHLKVNFEKQKYTLINIFGMYNINMDFNDFSKTFFFQYKSIIIDDPRIENKLIVKNKNSITIKLQFYYKHKNSLKRAFEYINKFYVITKYENISLSTNDWRCLFEPHCLNDNIINFYLNYMKNELIQNSIKKDIFIFDTFFYKILNNDGFRAAKRIPNTNKVKIFSKKFLFIPIHQKSKSHWVLIIVCFPNLILNENRLENFQKNFIEPSILYCDSLQIYHEDKRIHLLVKNYLKTRMLFEHPEKKNIDFNNLNLNHINMNLDVQKNDYDCGVFLLSFIDYFIRNPINQIPPIQKKLFNQNYISGIRKEILNILKGKIEKK